MSYLARKPIKIPTDLIIKLSENNLFIKGPLGKLKRQIHPSISLTLKDKEIIVHEPMNEEYKSLWATTRSLIGNMVVGVSQGHSQSLQIVGVGYKAELLDFKLFLKLGYSHPIEMEVPKTVTRLDIYKKGTLIYLQGIDKESISNFAKSIQKHRPPEPYKGKGISFLHEFIQRKEGKKK